MVYVSNGRILDSRFQSPWNLSFLIDLLWGAVEFIGLFFKTIIHPGMTNNRNSAMSGFSDGRGPPDPPGGRRRMGRIIRAAGPNPPPMGGGG